MFKKYRELVVIAAIVGACLLVVLVVAELDESIKSACDKQVASTDTSAAGSVKPCRGNVK